MTATNAQQRIFAVVGMHRSGTSCLTGSLEELGINLGSVSRANPHNRKGNHENPEIVALHDAILRDNGGSWDHPPPGPARWSPELLARQRAIIDSYRDTPMWGFKDPRSLLAIEGWLKAVPGLEFIGAIRHPMSVAGSLRSRDPRCGLDRGLALWTAYNERLLKLHQRNPFPIVSFDLPAPRYLEQIRELARRLGLGAPPELRFFEEQLRAQGAAPDIGLPPETRALYDRLRALSIFGTDP